MKMFSDPSSSSPRASSSSDSDIMASLSSSNTSSSSPRSSASISRDTSAALLRQRELSSVVSSNDRKNSPMSSSRKARRNHAIARGGKRGSNDPGLDAILIRDCPAIDEEAEDEGLYSLVQSGVCRRSVLTQIVLDPTVPCCDICDPSLLDRTCPGKRTDGAKTSRVKVGVLSSPVLEKLHDWRCLVKTRDFASSLFSADALLSDSFIDLLASVRPVRG
ncbi:hypothetical protein BDZ97DRAFT_1891098 [Flammula alnicola]|nr:hypothetical protein BDZ97DRAFT_1891098 [Flammula alnicola]